MKQIAFAIAAMLLVASVINAQSPQPGPEQKQLLVWVGHWTGTEERRDSASEPWNKMSCTLDVRTIVGGFFQEWVWKSINKGKETEYVEIGGFIPGKKINNSFFFGSDGAMGQVTSAAFTGNKQDVKYIYTNADGKTFENRITWTFAADSMSLSGNGESLMDGKWIPMRKVTYTKVKGAAK